MVWQLICPVCLNSVKSHYSLAKIVISAEMGKDLAQ